MNQLLVIDAGHGGADHGAIDAGCHEKAVTLRLASLVDRWAKYHGIETVLTRTSDLYVSLRKRVALERNAVKGFNGPHAFVSLHVNAAAAGAKARGVSVFHSEMSIKGRDLATDIFDLVREQVPEMPQYNAGVLADEEDGNLNDESFLDHALYVLKYTKSPAALVELGFVTNVEDRILLANGSFLDRAALGIVDGVRKWMGA